LTREREFANLYAKSIEFIASDESQSGEYAFIFNTIVNSNTINFPIVVTDARSNEPTIVKNVEIDSTLPKSEQKEKLKKLIAEMDEVNQPIKVSVQDTLILSYLHYGQSTLVTNLQTLPIIQFIVAGVFIFLGYFGFNYIKRTEQSNLWVGLSRETAHQLGTPLSSLMGWNELIKSNANKPEKVTSLTAEMTNDLDRLNKIANRFSKIGSKPDLKQENVYCVIEKIVNYFKIRIPRISTGTFENNTKSKVDLSITGPKNASALINGELFEWVLENLTKNALDAIETSAGKISFDVQDKGNYIL
jgi:signal transduction histidine kinase